MPQGVVVRYVVFEGKQDLQRQLERRLRGWLEPNTRFVVLHDQDSGDCKLLKRQLQSLCVQARKPDVLVRIACHELESFYLGDLRAVEQALDIRGVARLQASRKFRTPDALNNAAQELKQLTDQQYQKLLGSRRIGACLALDGSNRSVSFGHLVDGVRRLMV